MLKNYFKIAFRNLLKNWVSSVINIGGLAAGMAVAMLIGLWIYDELSFNKYHQHYDQIGQVMIHNGDGTYERLPVPLASELRAFFSEDFKYVVLSTGTDDHIISAGDKKFKQGGDFMQAEAPEMLTLKMISGSREGLKTPGSMLLKQSLAKKLFGNRDPINQLVTIDNKMNVKVTGVFEDLPLNSAFKDMTFIAPWDLYVSANDFAKKSADNWKDNSFNIYVELARGVGFDQVSARIKDLKLSHTSKEKAALYKPAIFLQPMSKWHLFSKFDNRVIVTSEELKFVWFYGIIGFFVLMLACINFMNLSTARSEKRAKEVGIRKAMGSWRNQLVKQFFSESMLVATFSFFASLLLVQLSLPWFNAISGKNILIPWTSTFFWMQCMLFIFVTGFAAGSYPAFYLSSFNAVKVLKGTFRTSRFAALPRKALVVIQFTVSIALIIGTIVVYQQVQFARNRPTGYSRQELLSVDMSTEDFQGKYEVIRNELENSGGAVEVAESGSTIVGLGAETGGITWEGKDPGLESSFGIVSVTPEYGKTVGWQFASGRDFSRSLASDSVGFIINEAGVKYMGLKNPVGKPLTWKRDGDVTTQFRIVGVVKDMVMNSPYEPAYPTVFFLNGDMGEIFIKINPNISTPVALSKIETVMRRLIPSAPFDYKFVDQEYSAKFAAEERVGKLSSFFAILAVFISCLGLFGLSSFVAERRTKEIRIRKTLGASVFTVWTLLSKNFVLLIIISFLIASPISFYFMNKWLQNYQYRTEISWWIFGLTGTGALVITLLTVSFQAIKAAIANPVNTLRAE
jgi:putative ABC transport system permease protein